MFKKNCIDEVKKFNTLKLNKSLSANKLIGIQEINNYSCSSTLNVHLPRFL